MLRRVLSAAMLSLVVVVFFFIFISSSETRKHGMIMIKLSRRRMLIGPGSWPPSCRSKCGSCTPCKAVHVPIHPGMSIPLEYYPEAWRCKCGNKLYMP
ncbi:EPIDERMAL PATTERNING FACTOR-like protein 4 [Spinacia oleracea]|uniref:Epidermal patterning factor-like protein n=1 Tax=Spinacia oleracea TaxID=3562 RepID=A0A9R0JBV5_SPIOL|nr:EPIDERMAL PATTERNING FACTOR-like protein 4 [Spinacia oleracea]